MRPAILISLFILVVLDSVAQPATSVRVAPLSDVATYPTRSAPATATSVNTAEISSEIGTRIKNIHVKVGDIVAAGAALASLDCDSFNYIATARSAQLDALKARIELAKLKLKRTEKLAEKQSVSDEILDERKSELDILQAEKAQIRAEFRLARLDVNRCKVAAPFRALVTQRIAADGEFVQRGDAIVKVLDIDNVEVSAQIQLGDAEGIQASKDLWFEYASKRYPVVVRAALDALNTATRNQEIRLEFDDERALPGAGGQLYWQDKRPHIPGNLLVRRDDRLGIFRLQDNRASFVPLPGAATGRAVAVDFPMNTQLILEGYYGLSDGDLVSVGSP